MAETLRSQIADYEDYVHTGNEFLDIILKDKAAKAREKQIDFSALVDFKGMDFIEPLDISTIFSNALDNAMEPANGCRKINDWLLSRPSCSGYVDYHGGKQHLTGDTASRGNHKERSFRTWLWYSQY